MKHLFFSFFLFSILLPLFSQTSFMTVCGNREYREAPAEIIQTADGNFLGAYSYRDTTQTICTAFIQMDDNGNVLATNTSPFYAIEGIEEIGTRFFSYGYYFVDSTIQVLTAILDENCQVIKEKKYPLPYYIPNTTYSNYPIYTSFLKDEDKIYCSFSVYNESPLWVKTSYYVFSETGDSIRTINQNSSVYDFCKNPLDDGFIASGYFHDYAPCISLQLAYLDNTFEIKRVDCVESVGLSTFTFNCQVEPLKTNFLFSGFSLNYYEGDKVGVALYDTATTNLLYNSIGDDKREMLGAYVNGLSVNEQSEIFVGGTYGYVGNTIFSTEDSYIVVGKMDTLLNKEWEHYIGGDAYYDLFDMAACDDGGVILSATRFDESTNQLEYDACFIKLDANGLLSSNNQPETVQARQAIVYPNPGNRELHVRVAVQLGQCHMLLYDMQGRQVLSAEIAPGENTLNTSTLPAGTYIYHIQSGNQTVESGQWTKTR